MSILSTNSLASIQNVWSDYILLVVFIADADDVDEDGDEEQKKDKVVDDEELLHW